MFFISLMYRNLKTNTMTTQITLGQVKQIAAQVSEKFSLVNRGTYYNVIDIKTGKSSIEGGKGNLTSYFMDDLIQYLYLQMIGENGLYLDWQINGVDISNERKNYIIKIKIKIVELICGYK